MNNNADNILPGDNADKLEGLMQLHTDLKDGGYLPEEGFEKDALEGLEQLPVAEVPGMVNTLNKTLSAHLKKNSKKRRQAFDKRYVYITIVILLLLTIISFIIIKKLLG